MLYHVYGLCPRTDISLGRCGFGIKLWPAWKDEIEKLGLNQAKVNTGIGNMARYWLDGHGYSQIFDPDNEGFDRDKNKPPGPNARPLYDAHCIRVSWGEWGPEHITVPGNACGLDINQGIGTPEGGKCLEPHNVDSITQAHTYY